ncbi:hypothetical protein LILPAPAWES_28 [Morganella phage vB_MmoP_Lilpapawes]|uniref:Uncharacterized protein n=1 Tax=Morganella phage vB_MmoP_Lilpapawes TaxID=2894803 RepID=A0AAE8YNW1_9CAUD|nr:hypothetical protein LILPAPAWES_28 [Morganella phage vB_MmoP_Lilpapawes]
MIINRGKMGNLQHMFYKNEDGVWRFCVQGGSWSNLQSLSRGLFSDHTLHRVNNFKEKQKA